MNAFLYLVATSARNRLRFGLNRVRSPRYAAALVVGGLYLYSFLIRPAGTTGAVPMLLGQPTEMIVTLLAVLTLMGSWIFGSDATALAFSQAEVSMLFSAPVSRRSLIGYKLFRAQITVLINALVWVFVLRRGGTLLPSPLRAISLWVLFSTLNLHRLGAALVRSSWREHGRAGVWRHRWSIAVFVLVGILVIAGVWAARTALLSAQGPRAFFNTLGRALARPPAIWGLFPFHVVVAPTFARSMGGWARAIGPAVLVMAAHVWWVLRTDTAFEDAAIDASAERARRIQARSARLSGGGTMGRPRATSTVALAATGHPAIAIFWKNMLCLRRTAQLRVFIGPTVMAVAFGAATAGNGADGGEIVATCCIALAAMLLLFGGRLIRNDLRHDMQHLPLIKSLPVAPGTIVLAEVASATLPMAAAQTALIVMAYIAVCVSANPPLGAAMRFALLVAAPFAFTSLSGALLTIQNGTAVLFPAWVRLGPVVNTGVEALGQNVLAMIASLFSLAIGLIIPLGVAFGVTSMLNEPRAAAVGLVIILSSLILAAETYGVMRLLGGALARAEPMASE